VTPCSLVEINPYFGRTCYSECTVSMSLWNNNSTWLPHLTFQKAVFSKVTVMIALGHTSPSLFLWSVSIQFLSDLWNLYSVIQEERSVFWDVVVSVIVRQTDSLYGHVQLWLATEVELLESANIKTLWTAIRKREITDSWFNFNCSLMFNYQICYSSQPQCTSQFVCKYCVCCSS
jgi:hypothetical protein